MKKGKLIVLAGLPASGKSTKAKELIVHGKDIIRINRDLLREMMHFGKYSRDNEREIMNTEKLMAQYFIQYGFDVIVDDTNLKKKTLDMWRDVADMLSCEIEIYKISTPIEVCIERDKNREKSVGEDVIRKMVEWDKCVDSH